MRRPFCGIQYGLLLVVGQLRSNEGSLRFTFIMYQCTRRHYSNKRGAEGSSRTTVPFLGLGIWQGFFLRTLEPLLTAAQCLVVTPQRNGSLGCPVVRLERADKVRSDSRMGSDRDYD